MTMDELMAALEIAEDKKTAATKTMKDYLDGAYVPKARFNEVNEEKKTLQATVTERDKQLDELKKSAGDNDALKEQIKTLQAANAQAAKEHEAQMKDLKLTSAIHVAIAGSAQDADIVAGLVDKSKLILGEDGKIAGLDEQITALKTAKPFLFKQEQPGYKPNGGNGSSKNPFAKDSFNLTEQGKLFRENPEQARALAAAAGVNI